MQTTNETSNSNAIRKSRTAIMPALTPIITGDKEPIQNNVNIPFFLCLHKK